MTKRNKNILKRIFLSALIISSPIKAKHLRVKKVTKNEIRNTLQGNELITSALETNEQSIIDFINSKIKVIQTKKDLISLMKDKSFLKELKYRMEISKDLILEDQSDYDQTEIEDEEIDQESDANIA